MAARIAQNCRLLKFRSLANLKVRNFSKVSIETMKDCLRRQPNDVLIILNSLSAI